MTQYEEMHTLIVGDCDRGINLLLQTRMLVNLECVRHTVCSFVPNEAFFKNQWCIPFHILDPPILFPLLVNHNV